MPSDGDACNICDGGRSTTKNPIIFCDGKGCNMPVHKLCYNVKEIPEDDWYCQRCEYKKKKKAANIICCTVQSGAIKKTTVTGDYMHVVCAMWNQKINMSIEPYVVNKSLLDKWECYYCEQNKGITIHCEEPNCNIRFHATCGINNSLITPAFSVPADFIPKCSKHQTVHYKRAATTSFNKKSKGNRRLRRNDSEDDESSSEEESDSEDEDEESEQEEEEEEEEEDDESDDDQGDKRKDGKKKSLMMSGSKRESKPLSTASSITPLKRRASPQSLFPEDQQSSDDDDDMGTSSSTSKLKLNTLNNKPSLAIGSSATVPPSATTPANFKDRLEAKRKKVSLDSRQQEDIKKPLTITPPPPASAAAAASTSVTQKQKLPNRAHLTTSSGSAAAVIGNGIRFSNSTPPGSSSIKRPNGLGMMKDIDEIYHDAKTHQRWNNSSTTPLHHPQPTTPHTVPQASIFENDVAKSNGQRKPMDWKLAGNEKEEIFKLKEENRKLVEFKRAVSEIFTTFNVPVSTGVQPDFINIESYVAQLQGVLRRSGFTDQDRISIKECTKGLGPPPSSHQ